MELLWTSSFGTTVPNRVELTHLDKVLVAKYRVLITTSCLVSLRYPTLHVMLIDDLTFRGGYNLGRSTIFRIKVLYLKEAILILAKLISIRVPHVL